MCLSYVKTWIFCPKLDPNQLANQVAKEADGDFEASAFEQLERDFQAQAVGATHQPLEFKHTMKERLCELNIWRGIRIM